jgi:osomolarity two-component system, response regulator SKN7
MPKLDGVSATNLIRQFDHMTPIISMTSNSKPNEIMTYYHSGMNDILPKPFTKEGLLEMLEVCTHVSSVFCPSGLTMMMVMHVL